MLFTLLFTIIIGITHQASFSMEFTKPLHIIPIIANGPTIVGANIDQHNPDIINFLLEDNSNNTYFSCQYNIKKKRVVSDATKIDDNNSNESINRVNSKSLPTIIDKYKLVHTENSIELYDTNTQALLCKFSQSAPIDYMLTNPSATRLITVSKDAIEILPLKKSITIQCKDKNIQLEFDDSFFKYCKYIQDMFSSFHCTIKDLNDPIPLPDTDIKYFKKLYKLFHAIEESKAGYIIQKTINDLCKMVEVCSFLDMQYTNTNKKTHSLTDFIYQLITKKCDPQNDYNLIQALGFDRENLIAQLFIKECVYRIDSNESPKNIVPDRPSLRGIILDPNGTLTIGFFDESIELWDTKTDACIKKFNVHTGAISLATFGPNDTLAIGLSNGIIQLWNTKTYNCIQIFNEHTDLIFSVVFGPNNLLATKSHDKTIKLWNTATGTCIQTFNRTTYKNNSIVFSPNGTLAIGFNDGVIQIWDTKKTVTCIQTFNEHINQIYLVAFSCNHTLLAIDRGGIIKLWNIKTGNCKKTFEESQGVTSAAAFHPNGILAIGFLDETIKLQDIKTYDYILILKNHVNSKINFIEFGPDNILATASGDGTIQLWNTKTGGCIRTSQTNAVIDSINFHPNGAFVAVFQNQTMKLWNINNGSKKRLLRDLTIQQASLIKEIIDSINIEKEGTWEAISKKIGIALTQQKGKLLYFYCAIAVLASTIAYAYCLKLRN